MNKTYVPPDIEEQLLQALLILNDVETRKQKDEPDDHWSWALLVMAMFAIQKMMDPGGDAARRFTDAGGVWF